MASATAPLHDATNAYQQDVRDVAAALPGGFVEGAGELRYAQTMAFTTLVLAQLFNALNARSDERSALRHLFGNRWLWGAIVLALGLQVAVVYVPALQRGFGTVGLGAADWLQCAAVASAVLWLREANKLLTGATDRHRRAVGAGAPAAARPRPD